MRKAKKDERVSHGNRPISFGQQNSIKKRRWWFQELQPIDRFTGWLVVWTALLCVATIISAIVLAITDHTLRETLTETKKSADAAISAAQTARDAMLNGQRAFVYVTNWTWRIVEYGDKSKAYQFLLGWENTGNTPPRHLAVQLACAAGQQAVADPKTLYKDEEFRVRRPSMGAKQTAEGGVCEVPFSIVKQLQEGKASIYIVATATYEDIFGRSRRTEYCREIIALVGAVGQTISEGGHFFDRPCQGRNCADDECD